MNEFKVGLLAIIAMASVVYMSFQVTSNQSGFGEYITYRSIIRDASGIFPKTSIKVAGINAGRIQKIELEGNNALITYEVLSKIKVPTDSMLQIKAVGFLGDKYLEIFVGKDDKFIKHMGFIKAEEGGGVEALVKDAADIMKDVKVIVGSLKDSLAPKDQEPPIKKILDDVQELVKNTKVATASLKNILKGNEEKFNNIIANIESFSDKLAFHIDEEQENSAMEDLKNILGNADQLTTDLKTLVADIKAGKGTLGKILVEEEIADEVKATLAGVQKIVGKVDAIRTELGVYSGINTDYGSETTAQLKIFPAPERFYLLGITTSEFGPESEIHTTTVTDGVTSNEVLKRSEKDSYRFNVQIGRKIHNWSFRGGLIESSGGFGVDYDVLSWGTRFTTEVFDYREDLGVNLRLASEVQIWNVFFGRIAGEDLLNDTRSATFSAGLRFNDEDLKGLIGFFL
jgi:phospholipid/cholesterol/gamma-HCH transport system substrate-binding protein